MDHHNQNNRFQDYSAPGQQGMSGQPQTGGYNLNGQYYESSSYQANTGASGYSYGEGNYNNGNYSNGNYNNANYNNANYNNGNYGSPYNNGNYGNPYNNGAQNPSGVPLDKKGRPIRNRFGLKLTFSILEIVFGFLLFFLLPPVIALIAMAFAILALVFTCVQNSHFHKGNWKSFHSASVTATVFLWLDCVVWMIVVILFVIGLAVLASIGSGSVKSGMDKLGIGDGNSKPDYTYEYEVEDPEDDNDDYDYDYDYDYDSEDSEADDNTDDAGSKTDDSSAVTDTNGDRVPLVKNFNKFTLAGADIALPISVKDFCRAGFSLDVDDSESELKANDYYGYGYYDADGDYRGTLFVYNTTDETIKVKDGIVGGITIDDKGEDDLQLVGGIGFGDSLSDCVKVLGNQVTYSSVGDSYSSYQWFFEDGGYSTSIELDFRKETNLHEVWIMNNESLR